ncbi:FitA-like ribbon-helix-helix domain-containing protein [Halochromatium glycolicum]|uniref:FitA-like ribbon-helix-helix domain-containing protein n=1 Tax=Halochromatium glycolicum TaxID=85075 RepID=UPI003B836BAD
MASVTVRNPPEETHRALRARAAAHGRSTEAEIRAVLESAVRPEERVKLGCSLAVSWPSMSLRPSPMRTYAPERAQPV